MSIEKDLKRIADALETISIHISNPQTEKLSTIGIKLAAPTPAPTQKVVAPTPAPTQKVVAPIPTPTQEATAPQMSPEELNESLSNEFTRLGGTDQNKAPMDLIFSVIKGFGVDSITTLPPSEYTAVLEKVRAL